MQVRLRYETLERLDDEARCQYVRHELLVGIHAASQEAITDRLRKWTGEQGSDQATHGAAGSSRDRRRFRMNR